MQRSRSAGKIQFLCISMSLFIASLNSGSNGNCYYVGNERDAVLIDAGISCRETEKRMKRLGLEMSLVRAIFISHEHSDHIRGVEVLSRKHKLPVFITSSTQQAGALNPAHVKPFRAYCGESFGGISVTAFPKSHDAADAHSFIVEYDGITVGVLTDIGYVCQHVLENFRKCHAVFLEANYDEQMLEEGAYPWFLKNRIRNDKGHLSNTQALELYRQHKPAFMSHVILSHLSKNNNSPQLVKNLFTEHANGAEIIVASRDYETDVYCIGGTIARPASQVKTPELQTSLF